MPSRRRARLIAVVLAVAVVLVAGVAALAERPDRPDSSRPRAVATTDKDPVLAGESEAGKQVRSALGGKQPNVIVVVMDDMRHDELRFAPTVVGLARQGAEFVNSFSPYPLCCPARASFLTGQLAHNHGVLFHGKGFGFAALRDDRTLATQLRGAGYLTGFSGKYLNGYGRQELRGSGESSARYVPPGWTDWRASLDEGWGGRGGTYNYFALTQNVNGTIRHNQGSYSSAVIAEDGAELVERFAREDAPFFLNLNPVAPHYGGPREADDPTPVTVRNGKTVRFVTPARPDSVKGRLDMDIPAAMGVPTGGRPAEADMRDKPPLMASSWPEATATEKRRLRDVERQRAESILAWDQEFRKVVDSLRTSGELDETFIVFTSDNGYYNGEHRRRAGKIFAHDPVLRVPLVVTGPGIRPGLRYAPATTVDVTATVLDLARAGELPAMDGRSLLPVLVGPDQAWTAPVVTEGRFPRMPRTIPFPEGLQTSGIRTPHHQLIMYANGTGELYDQRADPNQLQSLFDDPRHAALRDRLVTIWRQYQTCSGAACHAPLPEDLRATPEELAELEQRRRQAYLEHYR